MLYNILTHIAGGGIIISGICWLIVLIYHLRAHGYLEKQAGGNNLNDPGYRRAHDHLLEKEKVFATTGNITFGFSLISFLILGVFYWLFL